MNNINWIMELVDTVFSLAGKYARWLNVKGRRFCFIIWAFVCVYWAARDVSVGFYSQGFFCIISVGLNLYGYWNWKDKGIDKT